MPDRKVLPPNPLGPISEQDQAADEVLPRGDATLALRYLWQMLMHRRKAEAKLMDAKEQAAAGEDLAQMIAGLSLSDLQEIKAGLLVIGSICDMVQPIVSGLVAAREAREQILGRGQH